LKNISAADAILILPTSDAETVLNFAEAIIGKTPAVAIEIISQSVSDGVNLEQFAFDLIEIWRTLIIIKTGQQKINSDYSAEAMKRLRKLAEQIEYGDLVTLAEKTLQRRFEIKTAPHPGFPTDLQAPFGVLATQAAAKQLGEGGSIVNISSAVTDVETPTTAVYTGTKGALNAISGVLANELAPRKIRVNVVSPVTVRVPPIATLREKNPSRGRVAPDLPMS